MEIDERIRELNETRSAIQWEQKCAEHMPAILDALELARTMAALMLQEREDYAKIHDRDCEIAALREGLLRLTGAIDGLKMDFPYLSACKHEAKQLLSSPNPGAKVAAGLEAVGKFAQATNSKESREAELELLRAYRAINKEEESDGKD